MSNNITFAAIDFETANKHADSACSIGVVRVVNGVVVEQYHSLINTPYDADAAGEFMFTYLHGINKHETLQAEKFPHVWDALMPLFDDVDFITAYNASFDKRVAMACCLAHKLPFPDVRFLDALKIVRRNWNLPDNKLGTAAAHIDFNLNHHDALSDAIACAKIVLKEMENPDFVKYHYYLQPKK